MLHQHFKTPSGGGAIRSYYLARALVDRGHRVVIITTHNEKKRRTANVEGLEVLYLPIPYDNRFGFYRRAWSFIRYVIATFGAVSEFKDFEKCYAISAPLTVGLSARWIKFRYGIPYFFEVGDLWPDAPIEMGILKNSLLKIIFFILERSIYQHASLIVALSPEIQQVIEQRVSGKKVVWISNMADCEFFLPEAKDSRLEERFHVKGKFVVSYMGAMGEANGLDYFLACAEISNKITPAIEFVLCGDGARLKELKSSAAKMGLTNIQFIDFVNRDGVKELMNVTDAIFVCYKNVRILETGCPNKYFDGLAGGKMMIINFAGWIRKEMEENGCGVYVDPDRPDDFEKKISQLLLDPRRQKSIRLASRELAERKYSRHILGEAFAALF